MTTPENPNAERDLLNLAIWQRARHLVTQSPKARVTPGYEAYPDDNIQEAESTETEKITGLSKVAVEVEPVADFMLETAQLWADKKRADKIQREAEAVMYLTLGDTKVVDASEVGFFRGYVLSEDGTIKLEETTDDGISDVAVLSQDIGIEGRIALLAELEVIEAID